MATFENQVGAVVDNWASNAVGTTFTPASNHTVTSVDIYQHAGTSAVVKVHITNAASELPTTDLSVSAPTATVAGVNNIAIPCVALNSGTLYGIWIEYVSGTYNIDAITQGAFAKIAYNNSNTTTVPNTVTTTETLKFTIYGSLGVCGIDYTKTLDETVTLTASLIKIASRLFSEVLSLIPNLSRGIVPNIASGPNSPVTTADDSGVGTVTWTNPGNAKVSDNTYATTGSLGDNTP